MIQLNEFAFESRVDMQIFIMAYSDLWIKSKTIIIINDDIYMDFVLSNLCFFLSVYITRIFIVYVYIKFFDWFLQFMVIIQTLVETKCKTIYFYVY